MPPLIHPYPAASCLDKCALARPSSRGINWGTERMAGKGRAQTLQGTVTVIKLGRKVLNVIIFCLNDRRGT